MPVRIARPACPIAANAERTRGPQPPWPSGLDGVDRWPDRDDAAYLAPNLEKATVIAIFRATQTFGVFASLADHLEQARRRRHRNGERLLTTVRAGSPTCSVGRPMQAGTAMPIRE
jgi:hypothetical protein